MDKNIIIDGVNVAGCKHCLYKGFKAFPQCRLELDSFATACIQHKECEYKQLKRLEQENEELKEQLSGKTFFCENCENLARENEALKHRCEVYHQCDEMIKNTYGQAHKEAMRLTKENKEFKEYKTSKENSYQLLQKQWKDLFVQNRELKEENKALIEENEDMKKSFVSHSEFMDILENNPNINWEATAKENIYLINKYHKALEEIREMLCAGRTFYEDYFDNENLGRVDKAIKKINEALKDE